MVQANATTWPGHEFATTASSRAHTMQVCGTSGKRRAYPPDNKALPICCTLLPHNVRSKGPIYWKFFPPPTICSQRNQAVPSLCTHTVMPTYHTLNSETPEGKWSPLAITDPDYVMLWAACCLGFFGFMRGGGIYSHIIR